MQAFTVLSLENRIKLATYAVSSVQVDPSDDCGFSSGDQVYSYIRRKQLRVELKLLKLRESSYNFHAYLR
jgi:hypothetical protein